MFWIIEIISFSIILHFIMSCGQITANSDCVMYCPSLQQQTDCNFTNETGQAVDCACQDIKNS